MVWKERRAYRKQTQERKEVEKKEKERDAALKEAYPDLDSTPGPVLRQEKKVPLLEKLHRENERRREERDKEREEIEARKQDRLRQRLEWKRKFQKKTSKGQIPLDHRINYTLKKIKKQLKNS